MTDFSSIDRLMEFGLGMGLAQQMIRTMNYSIGNMAVAGVGINADQRPMVSYYAIVDNAQAGPLNDTELAELIRHGKITEETNAWCAGMNAWRFAKDIHSVFTLILLNR